MHKHKCVVNYYQYLVKVVDLIKKKTSYSYNYSELVILVFPQHYAMHTSVLNLYSKLSIGHRSKKKKET